MRSRPIATWRLGALRLATAPAGSVSFEDVERLLSSDAGLAHKLLRYANSALMLRGARVGSVGQALIRLGSRSVVRWATLLALSDSSDRPQPLLISGLIRARRCELLATETPGGDPRRAYTTGLLSVIDGLLDTPLPELLDQLALDERLARALLDHDGPEGRLLHAVLAYERGDFSAAETLHPHPELLAGHYRSALAWADRTADAFR